jgi:glutamyl-tRNA reductase
MAPKTNQELAEHLETIVAQYIAEAHRAAQQALERAFASASTTTRKTAKPSTTRLTTRRPSKRRPAEELGELAEQLVELVRAQPGESMSTFATELALPVRSLHRPMMQLKRDGRVRSVGERQHTRYFPTAAAKSRAAG